MPSVGRVVVVCLVAGALTGGCAPWRHAARPAQLSLLRPAVASQDSVTLEILFARFPDGQPEINGPLWEQIDEQHLSNDLRRRLDANGIRAGLVGGQIPGVLAKLLNQTDQLPSEDQQLEAADLESEPVLRRRLVHLRAGRRGEILASGIYDSLPLLIRNDDELSGHTFTKAQGLLAVHAAAKPDRRVEITLTPELHHGDAHQQWSGREGAFRLEMARPREVFDQLQLRFMLAPGQMLVLTSLPDRPGSLGHYFFSDSSARGPEQKLLVIRLAQMPPEKLHAESSGEP